MSNKRLWEIGSFKVEAPKERSLQILFSPQVDKDIENCTILMSTIAPHTGKTGIHTHPVDEVIYIITGRGEGEENGKTFKIVPGTIIPVSYTHLRAHETRHDLVCRLLLEKKKTTDQ